MYCIHSLFFIVLICLGREALGGKIINGEKVQGKTWKFMASLQNKGEHFCGGFLVSKHFVLTAAHCDRPEHTNVTVVLGTKNLNDVKEKEMRYNVTKCKHPDFANVADGNDIMLLKLSRPANIKPIPLPKKDKDIKNDKCFVAGWGYVISNGEYVNELRKTVVSTISLKTCQKEWSQNAATTLPANVICAGGFHTDKGFCQGDSGGPLVCHQSPVGIVSFNYRRNCAYPNLPNMYTKIGAFLPWIKQILNKNKC